MPNGGSETLPGRSLVHPVAIAALLILLLNDHYLKASFPSTLTGKLSDVTGLVVLPLLLTAAYEWARYVFRGSPPQPALPIWIPVTASAVVFSSIQLSEVANSIYEVSLGFLQWVPAATAALVGGETAPPILEASKVLDPTDLVALPALVVPAWIALRARNV